MNYKFISPWVSRITAVSRYCKKGKNSTNYAVFFHFSIYAGGV